MYFRCSILFYFCISLIQLIHSERLHKQIYSSIEGGAACFRRLNGTHQAGCSSPYNGAVGVVELIQSVSDAQWLAFNSTAGPYIAVVSTAMFHNVIEIFMENPNNVAGILLYDNETASAAAFSQESRCPNEYSAGPGSQCSSTTQGGIVWNGPGTGLMRRDIPFPIFFQSSIDEIGKIEKCYTRYNLDKQNQKGNPLCSIQLNSFMYAAVNSMVCMRRSASTSFFTPTKVCDPLGDRNVHMPLFPRVKGVQKKPVILVTGRIDSASLFDGVSPGAASSVVGMVTLITSAVLLAQMIPINQADLYKKNVLWVLFNGESFDYIGSQRVAYDLGQGAWPPEAPLAPADVELHVEVGQIGGGLAGNKDNASWPLHAFAPVDAPSLRDFLLSLDNNANENKMTLSQTFTTNLPPSSLHSFRRILKNVTENGQLPELLIADHTETFNNLFYESPLDDEKRINFVYHNISIGTDGTFISTEELLAKGNMTENEPQVKISRLATALARTLHQQVTGLPYTGNLTTSAHLVDEMLYCFLTSQACRLLLAVEYASGGSPDLPTRAAPLYVGVTSLGTLPAVFAAHLLAMLAGNTLPATNKTTCEEMNDASFTHLWLKGFNHTGVCVQTTMNFSHAVSPAFIIPDYDMASGTYSSWTESVWQTLSARVFVRAGGGGARAAGAGGALATLLAAAVTYWLRRHADVVFGATPARADAGILRSVNC